MCIKSIFILTVIYFITLSAIAIKDEEDNKPEVINPIKNGLLKLAAIEKERDNKKEKLMMRQNRILELDKENLKKFGKRYITAADIDFEKLRQENLREIPELDGLSNLAAIKKERRYISHQDVDFKKLRPENIREIPELDGLSNLAAIEKEREDKNLILTKQQIRILQLKNANFGKRYITAADVNFKRRQESLRKENHERDGSPLLKRTERL